MYAYRDLAETKLTQINHGTFCSTNARSCMYITTCAIATAPSAQARRAVVCCKFYVPSTFEHGLQQQRLPTSAGEPCRTYRPKKARTCNPVFLSLCSVSARARIAAPPSNTPIYGSQNYPTKPRSWQPHVRCTAVLGSNTSGVSTG